MLAAVATDNTIFIPPYLSILFLIVTLLIAWGIVKRTQKKHP